MSTITDSTDQMATGRVRPALIVTLALLAAVAPFATDLYLPAFPQMVQELHTSATGVQLSLTAFLVGAGVGQLFFGPLSDRIGRFGPLLAGLGIYLLASIASALAPNIGFLVAMRLVQGLAGAAGMVLGRAIISDLSHGVAAAKALSLMMLVGGIAPILAPFMGSLLTDAIGWRGLLGVVAGLGALSLVMVLFFVRESLPASARNRGNRKSSSGKVFSRTYLGYALTYSFAFATMMAYISASPFIYQDLMGLSEVQYGICFGINAAALAIVSGVGVKLVDKYGPARLTRTGLALNLGATVVVLAMALMPIPPIWLTIPILVAVASIGLVLGNATALALEAVSGSAGNASAWLGFFQFVLAGLVAPLVSVAGENTALPMALTMVGAALIANGAFIFLAQGNRGSAPGLR